MGIATANHTYAQILGGVVHWIFTSIDLPEWNDTQVVVVDVTGLSPAPAIGWEATQSASGWAFAAPTPPVLTLAQQATAALAAGLTITSAGTPALDGTYSVDATAQQRIIAETTSILLNGTFADGATTCEWLDINGAAHTLPSVAVFKPFATAFSAYVAALTKCQLGQATALPASTASIP